MRFLQFILGVSLALGLIYLGVTQYLGRDIYKPLPTMLADLPWSEELDQPAHVATQLLAKSCPVLTSNNDLLACLKDNGFKTNLGSDNRYVATFESGIGFAPETYRLSWPNDNDAVPLQVDAVKL